MVSDGFMNTRLCCFYLSRNHVLTLAVVCLSLRERSLHSGMSIHFQMFCFWSSCFGVEQKECRDEGEWRRNASNKILRPSSFIQYNVTIAALLGLCVSLPMSLALSLSSSLFISLYRSPFLMLSSIFIQHIQRDLYKYTWNSRDGKKTRKADSVSVYVPLILACFKRNNYNNSNKTILHPCS